MVGTQVSSLGARQAERTFEAPRAAVYLRVGNTDTCLVEYFPKTMAALGRLGTRIHTIFFSELKVDPARSIRFLKFYFCGCCDYAYCTCSRSAKM